MIVFCFSIVFLDWRAAVKHFILQCCFNGPHTILLFLRNPRTVLRLFLSSHRPPVHPQQVNYIGYQGKVITLTHHVTTCILGRTAQLHYISAFFNLSKAEPAITPEYHQGVRLGNEFTERRRGREYHMWVRNVFSYRLFFFCFSCGPTLNEDRERGSALDRGGEGRGRWEFIEELGIMCSGQSPTQLFSIQWESERWNVAGVG